MITETIKILRSGDFYGAGSLTEQAKGKYQLADKMYIGRRKVKREIQAMLWLKR